MTLKTTPMNPVEQLARDRLGLQSRVSDIEAATRAIEASGPLAP